MATATYGAAIVFGSILSSIAESMILAYVPMVYAKLKDNTSLSKKRVVQTAYIMYVIISIVAIIITLLGYFGMTTIMGDAYESSIQYIVPVIIARLFAGYCQIHSNLVMYVKRTKEMAMITFITTIVNTVLLFILIPVYGIMGVAISYAVVQVVAYICYLYVCSKFLDLPWIESLKLSK